MLFPPMGRMIPSVRFVGICFLILFCRTLLKQKKCFKKCFVFEGKLCSPKIIFISGEQELLIKINGGAHRGADYFFIVVFCVLCVVSKRMCKCSSLLADIHFKSL